jgi:signal transduction histidine kinase
LQVLEGEILRLEQIISTFLDFARPPRPDKKPVGVTALLRECLAGIRARAELQNVDVRLDIAEPVPSLDADSGQLRQVIYNLMFNALDVLPQGGVIHVWAGLEATDERPDPQVVIRVEDSGPGLPAGIQDQIFEPFISSKDAGLGLGLSISRRIVEAHGGTIAAKTAAAGGAVFTLRLPQATVSAPGRPKQLTGPKDMNNAKTADCR